MERNECSVCKKDFKTKHTLKCHIERNKTCLKMRGTHIESKFKCTACDHVAMIKSDLSKHMDVCKAVKISTLHVLQKEKESNDSKENEQLRFMMNEKDKQIEQLLARLHEKDQIIKELAEKAISNSKPTTIHTTTNQTFVNNLQLISEEYIKDHAKNLTIEHIKKGAIGYSEYFLEYPLKERVVCTDYSRRKLKYKNEQGELVTDPEMTTLSDLLFKSIKDRNRELTIQYSSELSDKFKTAKDPSQLAYFMEVASKFSQQDLDVFKMFNGDKNDFFHDVLRNICSKTVVPS